MLVLFCAIAAGAYGGWWWWQQQGGVSAAESTGAKGGKGGKGSKGGPLVVKATKAVAKPMPVLIEAVGTVEPEHSVQVRAQVSGVLQSVQFKEGDKVKAGAAPVPDRSRARSRHIISQALAATRAR